MPGSLSALYGGRGLTLTRGEGTFVYDSDGRRYIDFFNGHGAALFGHADPTLTAALREAAEGLWSCGAGYESPARVELADILAGEMGGGRVFFCNSGTEAVEAALKLAVVKNAGRCEIIAARRGFHGRSCGALGLTFNPKYRTPFASIVPTVRRCAAEEIPDAVSGNTAAVFIEPVQGEGGVYPMAEGLGQAITKSCREHGALLAADEVQTGLGRCGAFYASSLHGLEPDILCVAKGLAGGMAAGAVVWRETLGDFPPHTHGSTYGGNELAVRVGLAAMKMVKERCLCRRARVLGDYMRSAIADRHIPGVTEVRGAGLLTGVEISSPSQEAVRALQQQGLLCLAAGPRVVRFLPSFAATKESIDEAAAIFENVMREAAA